MTQEEYNDERRCGMNNDLISRSELKKVIETYRSNECFNDLQRGKNKMVDCCIAEIDNAPTVEAVTVEHHNRIKGILQNEIDSLVKIYDSERPQGDWKYICSYANTHLLRYECSKCGRTVDVYKRQELLVKYPFCHCGAEMKGGADK